MESTELELPETMHIADTPAADPAPPAETERPKSERERNMERIAARYEDERAKENSYGAGQLAAEPVVEEAPEPPAPEPTPEPVAKQPEPAPEPRRFRVDLGGGAQFDVDEAQYAQLARMGAVANQAIANHQQQPAQPRPQQAAPSAPAPILDDAMAKEVVRRITYGDEAEGAKALQEALNAAVSRSPRIDPNAVVHAAKQQAIQEWKLERNLEIIGTEFPDVFNDRTLSQLAALKLDEIRKRDAALRVTKPDLDLYREACTIVRSAIAPRNAQSQSVGDGVSAALQAAQQPAPNERLERKRAAPRNPSAVDRRSSAAEAPRVKTNSEVVDEMRKSRGQMSMRA